MNLIIIKKWKIILVLFFLNGLLLFGVISPLIEKNNYYQSKTDKIQRTLNNLEKYKHYQKHHTTRYAELEKQYLQLQNQWTKVNSETFEKLLRASQRKFKLALKSQNISATIKNQNYSFIVIQQTLVGKYSQLLNYIKVLSSGELPVLLLEFDLINTEPESQTPLLSTNIKFRYFKL